MMGKHIYSDPTGGGDDITVEVPAWVDGEGMPATIRVVDVNDDVHVFTYEGEDDDDE